MGRGGGAGVDGPAPSTLFLAADIFFLFTKLPLPVFESNVIKVSKNEINCETEVDYHFTYLMNRKWIVF